MTVHKGNHAITALKDGYFWPIINFTASGDTVKVKVETKPGGTIKGRVVDEQDKPIDGVQMRTDRSGYFGVHGARTDADGRFALPGQDPDAKAAISASADGSPIEGVTVGYGYGTSWVDYASAKTDKDGGFSISDLPSGEYYVGQYKESHPSSGTDPIKQSG